MKRRNFIKTTSLIGGSALVGTGLYGTTFVPQHPAKSTQPSYKSNIGWAELAFVESDPGSYDPDFWQIMNVDHGRILRNTIRWALGEEPVVKVEGVGLVDTTVWLQKDSMSIHLLNLTNPMMMKAPFRELIPLGEQ